jgi:hypothetical protein
MLVTVKLGHKGKHVQVPEGYRLVTQGVCQAGDMFGNNLSMCWSIVESDDIGLPFETFDALIRKTEFADLLRKET